MSNDNYFHIKKEPFYLLLAIISGFIFLLMVSLLTPQETLELMDSYIKIVLPAIIANVVPFVFLLTLGVLLLLNISEDIKNLWGESN